MQRDRLLYQNFEALPAEGVLRFFQWSEATVSLGRFQNAPELEAQAQALKCPTVRRPTGGQAILHGQDLCWSIVSSSQGFLGKNLLESYHLIAQAVIAALQRLEINAVFPSTEDPYRRQVSCFGSLTPADLEIQGKKLVGSAQMRNRRAFLQQSSLPLIAPDPSLWLSLFPEKGLREQISLAEINPQLCAQDLIDTLTQAFTQQWQLGFQVWDETLEARFFAAASAKTF